MTLTQHCSSLSISFKFAFSPKNFLRSSIGFDGLSTIFSISSSDDKSFCGRGTPRLRLVTNWGVFSGVGWALNEQKLSDSVQAISRMPKIASSRSEEAGLRKQYSLSFLALMYLFSPKVSGEIQKAHTVLIPG